MRILCHAQQFSGVNIDETVVCASVDFLIKNQRLDDGALPEVKKVKKGRSMVVRNTRQLFHFAAFLRILSSRRKSIV